MKIKMSIKMEKENKSNKEKFQRNKMIFCLKILTMVFIMIIKQTNKIL